MSKYILGVSLLLFGVVFVSYAVDLFNYDWEEDFSQWDVGQELENATDTDNNFYWVDSWSPGEVSDQEDADGDSPPRSGVFGNNTGGQIESFTDVSTAYLRFRVETAKAGYIYFGNSSGLISYIRIDPATGRLTYLDENGANNYHDDVITDLNEWNSARIDVQEGSTSTQFSIMIGLDTSGVDLYLTDGFVNSTSGDIGGEMNYVYMEQNTSAELFVDNIQMGEGVYFELYPTYPPTGATTTITGGYLTFAGTYNLQVANADADYSLGISVAEVNEANIGYSYSVLLNEGSNLYYDVPVLLANGTYTVSYYRGSNNCYIDDEGLFACTGEIFESPDNTVSSTVLIIEGSDADPPEPALPIPSPGGAGNIVVGTSSTSTGVFWNWVSSVGDKYIGTPLKSLATNYSNNIKSKFPFSWAWGLYDVWTSTTDAYSGDSGTSTASNFVYAITVPTTTSFLAGMTVKVIDGEGAYDTYGEYFDLFRTIFNYVLYIGLVTTVFYMVKGFFLSLREED